MFVNGTCFCSTSRVQALSVVVNGRPEPVMAHGMPRLDYFRAQHPTLDPFATTKVASDPDSPDDPLFHSYASGFWGIARVPAEEAGSECVLALRARLDDGSEIEEELARIPAAAPNSPAEAHEPELSGGPLVAVSMATYSPDADMFRRQIDSIRAQTHANWICVISDDCSRPELFTAIERVAEEDPRFVVSRSPRRLGFYRNFERALGMAPTGARYVAMADQDDLWHPDKLETLISSLGDCQLAYSDARIVAPGGEVISDTYWTRRRNNHWSIASLLMANCVTGAASLFRRDLLEHALPFPPAQFTHFHDHWVALTALALGDITFVERPLYDYVQHGDAVIGHAAANGLLTVAPRLGRLERLRENPREQVALWRMTFFAANCRLLVLAAVLQIRCGPQMTRAKRRVIERFLRMDRSLPGLLWLFVRSRREFAGRPETLGAEHGLLVGFLWRRAMALTARDRPTRRLRMDAVPPPNLIPGPRAREPTGRRTRAFAGALLPLTLAPGDDVPTRVNILIPSVEVEHLPNARAELNLARRLTERGLRVRIVTTENVGPLPQDWGPRLEGHAGLGGLLERVEVVFAREAQGLEVSRSDQFVSTTWQTAHLAHHAVQSLGGRRFLYVIHEHEPSAYSAGSHAALASQSYALPHFALFSSDLLRDYFLQEEIGVFEAGGEAGHAESAAFQEAIAATSAPPHRELAGESRRLLFHARPDAPRDMFELGVLALDRALASGAFDGWDLHGYGSSTGERHIAVGGGHLLDMLPDRDRESYAAMLGEHDVGLALMYTPRPGPVPIEMASAGLLTVTNSFENKTPQRMAGISSNLIAVEPSVEAVAQGLRQAAAAAGDLDSRARGSDVQWSRDWDRSLDDPLMDRVTAFLEH